MQFDIRLPIGLLFLAIGLLLAGLGLTGDPSRLGTLALGVNIDLVWGLALMGFGAVMLALTRLGRSTGSVNMRQQGGSNTPDQEAL